MRFFPSRSVWITSVLGLVSLSDGAYKAPISGDVVTPFVCQVELLAIDYDVSNVFASSASGDEPSNYFLACSLVDDDGTVGDHLYTLNGLSDQLASYHERLRRNEPVFLSISEATMTSTSIQVESLDAVQVVQSPVNYSHVAVNSFGNKTALVVRVSTGNSTPIATADELYDHIFSSKTSLSNQMRACSFGMLTIQPSEHGVIDIIINSDEYLQDSIGLVNAAFVQVLSQVQEKVDSIDDLADLLFVILPSGPKGNWKSWASFKGKLLVFNDEWGSRLSAMSHAVGHSFGLEHANQDGTECADSTGYMGMSLSWIDFPARCFNAYNMWVLEWVSDKSITVDPTVPSLYKVASIVDYDKASPGDEFAILRVGNLFMQYNGVKGFNVDTGELHNKLVLVSAYQWETILLGGLDAKQPLFRQQTNDTTTLVVQVCNAIDGNATAADVLVVSVGYEESLCSKNVGATRSPHYSYIPTESPQNRRSIAPSRLRVDTSTPSSRFDNASIPRDWNTSTNTDSEDAGAASAQSSDKAAQVSKNVWIAAAVLTLMLLVLLLYLGVQLIQGMALARYRRIGSLLSVDGSSLKFDCADSSFTSASTRVFSNVSFERNQVKHQRPPESVNFSSESLASSTALPARNGDPCDEPPLKRLRREWLYEQGLWGASEI